jgi:hypothetical protein
VPAHPLANGGIDGRALRSLAYPTREDMATPLYFFRCAFCDALYDTDLDVDSLRCASEDRLGVVIGAEDEVIVICSSCFNLHLSPELARESGFTIRGSLPPNFIHRDVGGQVRDMVPRHLVYEGDLWRTTPTALSADVLLEATARLTAVSGE